MKKLFPLSLLLLSISLLSCSGTAPGENGGRMESKDLSAKTKVADKEIQSLYFYIEDQDRPLGGVVVDIKPDNENAEQFHMTLYYFGPDISQDDHTYHLTLSKENMKEIGIALADSGMLTLNGITDYTNGIPPSEGTYVLRAEFVSGEKYHFVVNGGFSETDYLCSYDWMEILWGYLENAGEDMTQLKKIYSNENSPLFMDKPEEEDETFTEEDLSTDEEKSSY